MRTSCVSTLKTYWKHLSPSHCFVLTDLTPPPFSPCSYLHANFLSCWLLCFPLPSFKRNIKKQRKYYSRDHGKRRCRLIAEKIWSQRNESLMVEFVVSGEGTAWGGRGGRTEKDRRKGQRISLKFLQAGSCLLDLPEMPAPTAYKRTCFPLGHFHSKWKPTQVLDQFFQLRKRAPNIPWLAYHKSRIPAIMMMIIALVIAAMQLLLSLMHLQSLLGIGCMLRIILAPAFKSNRLTQVNPTRWDRACWTGCQVWEEGIFYISWVQREPRLQVQAGKLWNKDQGETFLNCGNHVNPDVKSHLSQGSKGQLWRWPHCPELRAESAACLVTGVEKT